LTLVLFSSLHDAGRGPLAAAVLNGLADFSKIRASSAGLFPASSINAFVRSTAASAGLVLPSTSPRGFSDQLLAEATIIIHLGPAATSPPRARLWEVPFLRRDSVETFHRVRQILHRKVRRLLLEENGLRPRHLHLVEP
jgi:protein-tyrosine-phosphatase